MTVIRHALWFLAILALAYVVFAFYHSRWLELVISTGLFVLLIPIDMMLADTEAQRRLPPHGPVRKFGYREGAGPR